MLILFLALPGCSLANSQAFLPISVYQIPILNWLFPCFQVINSKVDPQYLISYMISSCPTLTILSADLLGGGGGTVSHATLWTC